MRAPTCDVYTLGVGCIYVAQHRESEHIMTTTNATQEPTEIEAQAINSIVEMAARRLRHSWDDEPEAALIGAAQQHRTWGQGILTQHATGFHAIPMGQEYVDAVAERTAVAADIINDGISGGERPSMGNVRDYALRQLTQELAAR